MKMLLSITQIIDALPLFLIGVDASITDSGGRDRPAVRFFRAKK
jgi:hypothetical protein